MAKDNSKNQNLPLGDFPNLGSEFAQDDQSLSDQRRVAVRYIRDDIFLTLKAIGFFQWGQAPEVQITDISSKGVHVSSSGKLKLNKKFVLNFEFKDGKQFQCQGIVVNETKQPLCYGIKFDAFNHALGDYLVVTQKDLHVKL